MASKLRTITVPWRSIPVAGISVRWQRCEITDPVGHPVMMMAEAGPRSQLMPGAREASVGQSTVGSNPTLYAISTCISETLRRPRRVAPENAVIPRALASRTLAHLNQRLGLSGPRLAAKRNVLCRGFPRFGFAVDSPSQELDYGARGRAAGQGPDLAQSEIAESGRSGPCGPVRVSEATSRPEARRSRRHPSRSLLRDGSRSRR